MMFKSRWTRDFRFLECHPFLETKISFIKGFDASVSVPTNKNDNEIETVTIEDDGNDRSTQSERPPLGVKAAKKARLQLDLVTNAASKLYGDSKGAQLSINNNQQNGRPDFSKLSSSLEKIADATAGMFHMWSMQ
jgi:hypothetical protein